MTASVATQTSDLGIQTHFDEMEQILRHVLTDADELTQDGR
ncbi:hypothetical protein ACIQPR_09285 [Streptomyces sp. NPDC091280]